MATKLSPTQSDFLKFLFGVSNGNLKDAAKKAIGSEDYYQLLSDELLDAIKKRADSELVLSTSRAVFVINKMLNEGEDGSIFFSEKLHKVATDILDRAGISKQDRPNNGTTTVGIVMLPNKAVLPEPPIEDNDKKVQATQSPDL